MSHAARAFRLELLQLYRSVPSSRVFSHIFRIRVPPERSPIYRNVPPFSSLTPSYYPMGNAHNKTRSHNCRLAPDKRRKRSRPGFEPRGGMGRIETICTMSSCLIGKSEGIPMVDTTIGAAGTIQPAEVKD